MQSGLSPALRPLVSVAVAQYFNLLKPIKRLDRDGQPFISTPYKLRHGSESVQVALDTMPMIGQLVTFVPAAVYQESYQRCGPMRCGSHFRWFCRGKQNHQKCSEANPIRGLINRQWICTAHLHQRLATASRWKAIPIGPIARLAAAL